MLFAKIIVFIYCVHPQLSADMLSLSDASCLMFLRNLMLEIREIRNHLSMITETVGYIDSYSTTMYMLNYAEHLF